MFDRLSPLCPVHVRVHSLHPFSRFQYQQVAEGIAWWLWTPVAIDPGGDMGSTWRTVGSRRTRYHHSTSQRWQKNMEIQHWSSMLESISIQILLVLFMTLFIQVCLFYSQYHPHRSSALVMAWNHSKSVNWGSEHVGSSNMLVAMLIACDNHLPELKLSHKPSLDQPRRGKYASWGAMITHWHNQFWDRGSSSISCFES